MMNVAKQSQMAGGMNMGFVVIAEPDEVNAARIKTILDSLDTVSYTHLTLPTKSLV